MESYIATLFSFLSSRFDDNGSRYHECGRIVGVSGINLRLKYSFAAVKYFLCIIDCLCMAYRLQLWSKSGCKQLHSLTRIIIFILQTGVLYRDFHQ